MDEEDNEYATALGGARSPGRSAIAPPSTCSRRTSSTPTPTALPDASSISSTDTTSRAAWSHDSRHRVEHAAGGIERALQADAGRLRGGIVDAPRERLPVLASR